MKNNVCTSLFFERHNGKNPRIEKELFRILEHGYPTIVNTKSQYNDLTFNKLFMYYGSKGISLRKETFKKHLCLSTKDGSYNILAQLLSDNSHLPLRVSIFEGTTKGSNLYSIKEFGFDCILYSLKNLLDYGDVSNVIQSDETNSSQRILLLKKELRFLKKISTKPKD